MWGRELFDWGYGYCSGMPFGGGFFHLLFWGLALLMFAWLFRHFVAGKRCPVNDSALELLRKRYAAGEITSDEYDEMAAKLI